MAERTGLELQSISPSTMPHGILVFFCLLLMAYGLFTPNPLETAWFACMLIILMRMWMWKQHPAILLYLFHHSVHRVPHFAVRSQQLWHHTQ